MKLRAGVLVRSVPADCWDADVVELVDTPS